MECKDLICDVCGHDAHVAATHRTRIIDDVSRARLKLDLCDEHWASLATGATALAAGRTAAQLPGPSNGSSAESRRTLPPEARESGRWAVHPCPVAGCDAEPSGGPGMRVHLESHRNRGDITDAEYARLREEVKRRPPLKSPAGIVYPIDCPVPGCDFGKLASGGIAAAHLRGHTRRGDKVPPVWVEFASTDQWAARSFANAPGYPRACPVPGCDRGRDNPIPSAAGMGAHVAKHRRRGDTIPREVAGFATSSA